MLGYHMALIQAEGQMVFTNAEGIWPSRRHRAKALFTCAAAMFGYYAQLSCSAVMLNYHAWPVSQLSIRYTQEFTHSLFTGERKCLATYHHWHTHVMKWPASLDIPSETFMVVGMGTN